MVYDIEINLLDDMAQVAINYLAANGRAVMVEDVDDIDEFDNEDEAEPTMEAQVPFHYPLFLSQ